MTTANVTASNAFAVWWKDLDRWDAKYFVSRVKSAYPVARLATLISEHSERIRPFDYPETMFRILGVNNSGGIFHAYDVPGKKINQPYQIVSAGDFAYNPYRVNVGSIGIVPDEFNGNFISPAYVVFTTEKKRLLPEFLLLILKADWYNPTLRAATAGSVRQNLTFSLLGNLEIPLPTLNQQRLIIERWQIVQQQINKTEKSVFCQEEKLPQLIYRELETPMPYAKSRKEKFLTLWWKDLDRWSFNYLSRANQGLLGFTKSKFPIEPLGNHLIKTMNGYCIKPVAGPTPYKMLKLNALGPAGLDLTASKYVPITEKIANRFSINKGDLFICRSVGSYDHIAKCALSIEDAPNFVFPDIMIRVQLKDSLLPEYVREVVQTPLGRSFFKSNARTAVGMWKIGADDIANFPIPVPPLTTQKRIVESVAVERREIARQRESAECLNREINAEIEALILGLKKL